MDFPEIAFTDFHLKGLLFMYLERNLEISTEM